MWTRTNFQTDRTEKSGRDSGGGLWFRLWRCQYLDDLDYITSNGKNTEGILEARDVIPIEVLS
jgi:hypothetical protein